MQLKGSLEENVLCLLCWDEQHSSSLALEISPELFSTRSYRKIATHALDHIQKYGKPPRAHIVDLLEPDLKRGEEGKFLTEILEAIDEVRTEIQTDFVLSKLDNFVKLRKTANLIEEAAEAVADGDPDKATEILQRTDYINTKKTSGFYLTEVDRVLAFMDRPESDFFSSGIPTLDDFGIHPERGTMFLFMAPPKRGKTWAAIQVGKAALSNRQKVLHVSLEMSKEKVAQRYIQALFAMSTRSAETIRVPMFKRDELGRCSELYFDEFTPKVIGPETRQDIEKDLLKLKQRPPIHIVDFPSGSLTIPQLDAYIDMLGKRDNFVPDLLILDYPDIMKVDPSSLRVDTGRIFVELRGLAQRRNLALFVPTQGNRTSSKAKLLTPDMVAEDWSKVMTTDILVTYNQTPQERRSNLARLFVAAGRSDIDKFTVLISQSYATGQFCLDSVFMNKVVEEEARQMSGEGDE